MVSVSETVHDTFSKKNHCGIRFWRLCLPPVCLESSQSPFRLLIHRELISPVHWTLLKPTRNRYVPFVPNVVLGLHAVCIYIIDWLQPTSVRTHAALPLHYITLSTSEFHPAKFSLVASNVTESSRSRNSLPLYGSRLASVTSASSSERTVNI
jgi:hypothetical protein